MPRREKKFEKFEGERFRSVLEEAQLVGRVFQIETLSRNYRK